MHRSLIHLTAITIKHLYNNWAKQRATDNFQSLSGYIAKILHEEQKRFEQQELNKEGNMKAS